MYEIPNEVTVVIQVNEPVLEFFKRVLRRAAEVAGLPLGERNLFADAYIFRENLQSSETIPLSWTPDPTPSNGTANIRQEDFNFLLLQRYLNVNERNPAIVRRGRRAIVSLADIQTVVGGVTATIKLDNSMKEALTLWRNDFIYRGGVIGSGLDAPVRRDALVPALQAPAAQPDITHVPSQMRTRGWNEGAALMEAWFSKPEQIRAARFEDVPDNFGPPITDLIKMDWVLNFDRAKAVYDQLVTTQAWKTPNAKGLLGRRLVAAGIVARLRANPQLTEQFGDLSSGNIIANHPNYIQSATVSQSLTQARDNPDGMTAALANFQMYMAVRGTASASGANIQFRVEQVGVYLRDSYDFLNDGFRIACLCIDQPLGTWSDGVGEVTNDSFNNWRKTNHRGGDFLIYSDVKLVPINPADNTFTIPV